MTSRCRESRSRRELESRGEDAWASRLQGLYMACNCLPRRKIICDFNPPRCAIQRRTGEGYIEYSICVASGLVTARPLAPKSHAAWNPRLACEVTQILSCGTAPSTMVQADAHRPSMMTVSPELRRSWYLST